MKADSAFKRSPYTGFKMGVFPFGFAKAITKGLKKRHTCMTLFGGFTHHLVGSFKVSFPWGDVESEKGSPCSAGHFQGYHRNMASFHGGVTDRK